jgi:hypothetical protein
MTTVDTSACVIVKDRPEDHGRPFCELAQEMALARKAALCEVGSMAESVLEHLCADEPRLDIARHQLRSIIECVDADEGPEVIGRDELIRTVMDRLSVVVSAGSSSDVEAVPQVTEQAIA